METVMILDTETTGLRHGVDHVIEVAWALWSVRHRCLLECRTMLVDHNLLENPCEHINHIPAAALLHGEDWSEVQYRVANAQMNAAVTLAHHADFDRGWFDENIQSQPWLCTKADIDWPRAGGKRSLVDLALSHGVGVSSAHRAMDDVLTLVRLLERAAELTDVGAMLERGMRPKALYQALVTYEQREFAKAAGFSWDGATKRWTRRMAIEDVGALEFDVQRLDP
jgi:DNA polymerase-3 subunit epsilon